VLQELYHPQAKISAATNRRQVKAKSDSAGYAGWEYGV
jgi:hypothetical protein